jgi:hypothetical protein
MTIFEYYFSKKLIVDTLCILTIDLHGRKEVIEFKREFDNVKNNSWDLKKWLDSECVPRW